MYKIHLIYKDPWMECDTHFLFVRQIALLEKSQMVRSMLINDDIEKQVEKYIGCVLHVPRSIVNFVMREKALHALLLGLHLSCMWSCPNLELGSSISVWFSRLSHAKSWTCKHAHNTPIHIFPNHSHNTHTWRFSNYINNHSLPLFPCSFSHRRSNIMSPASKRCVSLSFFSLSPPFLLIRMYYCKIRPVDDWCWWSWLLHLSFPSYDAHFYSQQWWHATSSSHLCYWWMSSKQDMATTTTTIIFITTIFTIHIILFFKQQQQQQQQYTICTATCHDPFTSTVYTSMDYTFTTKWHSSDQSSRSSSGKEK